MAERTRRLDLRLTSSQRKLIERAAILRGQTLEVFAVQVLVTEAEEIIAGDALRKLSARDGKRFLELLDDDSVTPALARARHSS